MNSCAADVQSGDQRKMPATAIGIVCLFGGLGISLYALAASLLVGEGVGIDALGLPKAVAFSALGIVAGVRLSVWLRLPSQANCLGALSASLLVLALWGFILDLNAVLANSAGISVGKQLGGGALSVSALENIFWAWLFFPGFLLQGVIIHLLFNVHQKFGGRAVRGGITFAATYAAGISLGCMAAWLSSFPAEFLTLVSMIACSVAALVSWIYVGAEGSETPSPSPPELNAERPPNSSVLFVIGLALAIAASIGDWILGLLLGPLVGQGLAAGVFAGGISFGIWSGRFAGDRSLDSKQAMNMAVMLGIAALAAAGLYGPFLSMKGVVVEWVRFRGADFYAPFFSAYAFFAAMALVFPLATVLGRTILFLGLSDRMEKLAGARPINALLFISAGAVMGTILTSDMLLAHIGVKVALFAFAALALLCGEFFRGALGRGESVRKRCEIAGTICVLLLAIFLPIHPLYYAIPIGIFGGIVAYVMPSIDLCLVGNKAKRTLYKLLGCSLALGVAFAGPIDQRDYFFPSTSSAPEEEAAKRQLVYGSQARQSNLQFFSNSQVILVTLVVNGIERDVFQKRGVLPPSMEPAVLAGILPILYQPEGGRVAVAGLSLGLLRSLLTFPEIEQVDTIEREKAALDGLIYGLSHLPESMKVPSPDPSLNILSDPRHSIIRESPKAYFSVQTAGLYDAIVLAKTDLADPYDSPQFSRNFYNQISSALNADGVFVQRIRMRSISGRDLAALISAIGDELGDYILYTSQEELIVVASKRGQILPAISGEALRGLNDDKSPADLIGYKSVDYVNAHRLGGRKLFDPYFQNMKSPNFSTGQIYPLGSLFRPSGFALLESLQGLNFPLLALMEGIELPEPHISEEPRRYTWEALKFAYALSLYEHFAYGKWDRDRFRQEDTSRIARVLEAKVCPKSLAGWVDLVVDLRVVMTLLNPRLNVDKMVHFWKKIDEGCLGNNSLPVEVALLVNYYRALSVRDFGAVLQHGKVILMGGGMTSEMGKEIIAALVVAGQKEGRGTESMESLLQYLPYLNWSGIELMRFVGSGVFEDISRENLEEASGDGKRT